MLKTLNSEGLTEPFDIVTSDAYIHLKLISLTPLSFPFPKGKLVDIETQYTNIIHLLIYCKDMFFFIN